MVEQALPFVPARSYGLEHGVRIGERLPEAERDGSDGVVHGRDHHGVVCAGRVGGATRRLVQARSPAEQAARLVCLHRGPRDAGKARGRVPPPGEDAVDVDHSPGRPRFARSRIASIEETTRRSPT
jgi:hypothetical protein